MRRLALGRFGTGVGNDPETRLARIEAALGEVELASHEGSVGDLPSTLVDPNADKALFWSDKKKEFKFLNSGSGIKVDSDDNGEGHISLDVEAGTGIAITPPTPPATAPTISIDLDEGTGIDIAGNTISMDLVAGTGIHITGNTISADPSGVTADLIAGTGITIIPPTPPATAPTIAINLAEGDGIDITGNSISVEPNLQTINALTFAADKLIRITGGGPPTADLIDFNMGLYTPTAILIAGTTSATPLESMYFRIGLMVGVFGRINIDPASGSSNAVIQMSIPIPSAFINPRDAVGTANSGLLAARIQADAVSGQVMLTVYASGGSSDPADFSFVFWYRIL